MSIPDQFRITCYLAWCGAEATYAFYDKGQYDAARAFLDKIAGVQVHGGELPPRYSRTMTDYYVIEARDRAAFQNFMQGAEK